MPRAYVTRKHPTYNSDIVLCGGAAICSPGEGAEPELDFVNRDRVWTPTRPQAWHRPFAEALLTGDSTRAQEAIVCAQRAVLTRYLELAGGWEVQPGEIADLANAVDILQALKRTTDRTSAYLIDHSQVGSV
jgi:hypothetical protein